MKLNKRERLVVAGGTLVGVAILLVGSVVLPFLDSKREVAEEIGGKQRKLETYQTFLQRKGEYLKELEAVQASWRKVQNRVLQVNDTAEAEARLRDTLNQYAQANGVTITRTNILQEEKLKDGYSKVAIDFNVSADIGPLTRFLYGLVTNTNFLEIRQVNINAYMNRNQVVLQPRITLAALVRRGQS
ncbi:MAG: hypothetical protein HYX74_07610 [Acidobacteria bacterium]|nr:hypothetical protein [Acidobacteriota bacterium]